MIVQTFPDHDAKTIEARQREREKAALRVRYEQKLLKRRLRKPKR